MTVLFLQSLARRFLFYESNDNLPLPGVGLLAHDDRVAAENARVYHGIAADVQGEIRTGFSVQINIQHRLLFLDRQDRLSGGHAAEQGNSRRSGLTGYLDGSRFSGTLLQIAQLAQMLDVRMNRGGRAQPHSCRDFPYGRRVSFGRGIFLNELQDLFLFFRNRTHKQIFPSCIFYFYCTQEQDKKQTDVWFFAIRAKVFERYIGK